MKSHARPAREDCEQERSLVELAASIGASFREGENGVRELRAGVLVGRLDQRTPRSTAIYRATVCVLAQGYKHVYLGQERRSYGNGLFLLSRLSIAAETEVVDASPEFPLLGVVLELDLRRLGKLTAEIGPKPRHDERLESAAITSHPLTSELTRSLVRLTQTAAFDLEWNVLGEGLLREVYFYLLETTTAGPLLRSRLSEVNSFEDVARVLEFIEANPTQSFDVNTLARVSGMSVSGLHNKFKVITGQSPMQMVKSLRLDRARTQLMAGRSVTDAALDVGYVSPSQFSREFSRQYGAPPSRFLEQLSRDPSLR